MNRSLSLSLVALLLLPLLAPDSVQARNPYRRAFFNVYPAADGTQLVDLPSNTNHCGVCHFDFDGGGQRNPYGVAVEVALNSGNFGSTEDAIASLDAPGLDADNDGFDNVVEITDLLSFSNTPTFPGLKTSSLGSVLNVDPLDVEPYLTPSGATDTTPPTVTILSPVGGELLAPNQTHNVQWTASDDTGVARIDLEMSDDGGVTWKKVAVGLPNTGASDWFVPNMPGATHLKVVAVDVAGNAGDAVSPSSFTIDVHVGGVVPTTLRDFEMAGTQPFEGGIYEDPSETCVTCHGGYDTDVEPYYNWQGSMMSQAMRDPLYLATLVIAEQDAPASGDLCIRCHSPGGWQEGRSADTSTGMINAKDRQGVQCDYCHRLVDPVYEAGVSPAVDADILAASSSVPAQPANGQWVADPDPVRRGPFADAAASHLFLESEFHRSSDICATCHDVSNPAFEADGDLATYLPGVLDAAHSDGDLRNMFPVERTFSEWSQSTFASTGVYMPQFAGDKANGMVSTCQDCHMRDVTGVGANIGGTPTRGDLPLHDLTGGNYFVPDILDDLWPGEVDAAALAAGKARAIAMLQLAATLDLSSSVVDFQQKVLTATVTNETGHKLPSGYPEGRRMWLQVKAYDGQDQVVYESGAYDAATGVLTKDADAKVYEIKPGTSTRLGSLLGLPTGPSFHFVLNDTVFSDNRIPPRGFTNAGFEAIQSPPVDYAYVDGQYADATSYALPNEAVRAEVRLLYQSTSKEYIEFLRDENVTNSMGQELYDAWVANGRCAPVEMASAEILLDATAVEDTPGLITALQRPYPNPFNPRTEIRFSLAQEGRASLRVYDARGRLVRTLVDGRVPAGAHRAVWEGIDRAGRAVASGVYYAVYQTETEDFRQKLTLVR